MLLGSLLGSPDPVRAGLLRTAVPTRRRGRRWMVVSVGAVVALIAAWAGPPSAAPPELPPDLFLVRSTGGAVVVDATQQAAVRGYSDAVPSPDGSVVVTAQVGDLTTVLSAEDVTTGAPVWQRELDGRLQIQLVGFDGETVVLGPRTGSATYAPVPRSYTSLVVSRPDGSARTYELVGNYEPEALSTDGSSLFVISYLPPTAPENYQVRRLDLDMGEVADVFTPHEELQEEMGGTARTQAWSPDGRRLYTLYTVEEGGHRHGFVHVLDLDHEWAHCIDLPVGLPLQDEYATGIGVSPDGERLFVVDGSAGMLAEVDTRHLAVTRTTAIAALDDAGWPPTVAVAPDGRVVVAVGDRLTVLDGAGLIDGTSARIPGSAVGLHLPEGAGSVHVVMGDRRIAVLELATGERTDLYRLPGTSEFEGVGRGAVKVDAFQEKIVCAC